QEMAKALGAGDVAAAESALGKPKAEPTKTTEPTGTPAEKPTTSDTESQPIGGGKPQGETKPKEAPQLGEKGKAFQKALAGNGDTVTTAFETIKEVNDFRVLRDMVDQGRFGDTPDLKQAAMEKLQAARKQIVDDVLKGIQSRLQQENPGIKVELQ